jgi:hypothetical protein
MASRSFMVKALRLLSRRGKEMDMHFRRPESQRRQKFLVAVVRLPKSPLSPM